jgi:transposase
MIPTREEIWQAYEAGFEAVVALFESTFRVLDERVKALEARVSQTSANSHRPPASDGLRKPPPRSQRKKSGRRSGGQPGHAGQTLEMVAQPDRVEAHWAERCACCGEALSREPSAGYERRQVHDLPPRRIEVTEHRAMAVQCAHCGRVTRGSFPAGVSQPVQYGPELAALAVYAQVYQMLPLERTADLLEAISGRRLSEGTLVNLLAGCARRVKPEMEQVQTALVEAPALHTDETGIRVGKRLYWLHTYSTARLTYYAVHERRGQAAHEQIGILPEYQGTLIHDAYASYLKWGERNPAMQHALCNAHLLRDLTAIEEQTGQRWAGQMRHLLVEMKTAVEQAQQAGGCALDTATLDRLEAQYDQLVRRALRRNPRAAAKPPQRGRPRASPARNLAERLRDHKDSIVRFVHDWRVPFDNNLAERDLRMTKVKLKVAGCFRSLAGAHMFACIRGYLSTARKQGFRVLDALRAILVGQPITLQFG